MNRLFFALAVLSCASAAKADISHKIQSSVQLSIDAAGSVAERIGSTYSVSGTNITLDTAGGLDALTAGSAVGYTPADYSVTTTGDSFNFTETFIEGDATLSPTTITSGVTTSLPALGVTTTTSGGVAGSIAGTLSSDHALTISPGGAGTTAIGQIITEISID